MKGRRWSVVAAAVALAFAILAALYLALSPCFVAQVSGSSELRPEQGGSDRPPDSRPGQTVERSCLSFVESRGAGAIFLLLIPAGLAAGALAGSILRVRTLVWIAAAVLFLLCLLTGFSVGLFYFPAAWALVAAAVIQQVEPRHKVGPRAQS